MHTTRTCGSPSGSWSAGRSATWPTASRIGAAIDFLDPPPWPAFNVADIAIVAGVALLVFAILAPELGDSRA